MSSSATTSLIQAVLQASKRTFARSRNRFKLKEEDFVSSLRDLKCLLDNVRTHDLGLERSRVLTSGSKGIVLLDEAPCTYIKIHEDLDVSLGVFIIKPGFKIPLHNHPKMHGLLKVVHGKVDISVYTKTTIHDSSEIPPFLKDRTHLIDQGFVFPTTKEVLKSVTGEHEAVILSPELKNYHEIRNVGDGHAAFFDILAPPYLMRGDEESLNLEEEELRECHFFSEINHFNNNIHPDDKPFVWLRRVKSPDDYYCDTELYLGPQIHSE